MDVLRRLGICHWHNHTHWDLCLTSGIIDQKNVKSKPSFIRAKKIQGILKAALVQIHFPGLKFSEQCLLSNDLWEPKKSIVTRFLRVYSRIPKYSIWDIIKERDTIKMIQLRMEPSVLFCVRNDKHVREIIHVVFCLPTLDIQSRGVKLDWLTELRNFGGIHNK